MKSIPLTREKFALVDDEDYDYLCKWKWQYQHNGTTGYAIRSGWDGEHKFSIRMHREIMKATDSDDIDHKDGNGLNNCKSNLRRATKQENTFNRRKRSGCSSKYKGVCFYKDRNKWGANIWINYKQICIGRFSSEVEAALAYNEKARELFGEFAVINIVQED